MEVCVPCEPSAGQDAISVGGSSADPLDPDNYHSNYFSLVDLETHLAQYLNIEGIESLKNNGIVNVVKEDGHSDSDKTIATGSASLEFSSKGFANPPLDEPKPSSDELLSTKEVQEGDKTLEVCDVDGCSKSENACNSQPMLLPTSPKPVSAIKGSREKHGVAPKKLSVTWAPDVYDPIPTSVSHVPSSKNRRHRSGSKKSGKSKQKSSSKSLQGKTKDKKQPRKSSGSTNKIRPLSNDGGVLGFGESQMSILDFNVLQAQAHFAEVAF